MEDYVFVYGTLMRGFEAHDGLGVSERASYLGDARVEGELYRVDRNPALVHSETGTVEGELYRVEDPKLLDDIDRYEGYYPEDVEGSLYLRSYVNVVDRDLQAWAYVYNEDVDDGEKIGSGSWRSYVEDEDTGVEETKSLD